MEKLNWNDVEAEQVNPKMKRQFIHGEKIMIAKMEFEDGFTVPWHSHENEQVTEVIEGVLRFWFDDDENNPLDLFPDWRRYAARVRSVGISVPMNNDFALAGGLSI